MRRLVYSGVFVLHLVIFKAQLLPPIGLTAKPADNITVCHEPVFNGSFYTSGYQVGNQVPDFKLYGVSGDSLLLSQVLNQGKPVLLIAGSLTCPVFRAKVATINQVVTTYSSNIKVFVIYTIDAHPTDTSVYFGYVNVTSQNTSAGILFPQPLTYGDRKKMVDTMSTWVNLNAPVFIDGPCNTWWKNFGPAPNNSYLISTAGTVLNKHGWFHKSPDNIFCDLDSILGVNSGKCTVSTIPGSFKLNVLNASSAGAPGDVLYDFTDIINTSSVSTGLKIKKLQKTLASGWQSSFCADICYGTADDSIEISLDPYDTLHFSLDFYSTATPDSGSIKVGFKNTNKSTNAFTITFSAKTQLSQVSLNENYTEADKIFIYPVPATQYFSVSSDEKDLEMTIFDAMGKLIHSSIGERRITTENWRNGLYYVVFRYAGGCTSHRLLISN
jgi:hypothetical protein